MKVDQKIVGIFEELLDSACQLMQTRESGGGDIVGGNDGVVPFLSPEYDKVSVGLATEWGIRCLSFLKRIFDIESEYYQGFKRNLSDFDSSLNYSSFIQALSILKAARTDYENGYLFDTHILVHAEIFDDFLAQAEHLLKNGYYAPAAVIAGSVLEDGLRELCERKNISSTGKQTIDPMNVQLAKAGVYDTLIQKRITALADIRNKAAHGEWNELKDKDVEQMIIQVRNFLEDFFREVEQVERLPVTSDPDTLSGETVFRGTRVPVAALLDNIEAGLTLDEFLENFPTVTREQAIQVLMFAKETLTRPSRAA